LSRGYVFDQSRSDHERLVRQARLHHDIDREAYLRAGLRVGGRAIDVGCGPLGALPVLAELVGPAGTVVGLDMNADALAQARGTLQELGVNVQDLIQCDVNALTHEVVAPHGPFDLAVSRLVLMYQHDPAQTLRKIASIVRPGGRIATMDLLHDPTYPSFDPPVPAVERVLRIFFGLLEARGGTVEVARRYGQICEQAGLRLIDLRGVFRVTQAPRDYVELHRDILLGMRGNAIAQHLTTEDEVDALVSELDVARERVQFMAGILFVEMIAEVP
jgi:ubiquinone/menaquinone biosynthesis C-methylase UbiE